MFKCKSFDIDSEIVCILILLVVDLRLGSTEVCEGAGTVNGASDYA